MRVLTGWRGEPCGVVGTDELGRRCQIAGTYTFCAQMMRDEKASVEADQRAQKERSKAASSTMPKCDERPREAPEGLWSLAADGTYSLSARQAFSSKTDTELYGSFTMVET